MKPLGSSTRLPIHTLSICLFAVNIPILQSFHVVSKLILSHTHKKSPLEDFQYPNSSNSFPFSSGQCLKPRHGQQHPQMTTLPPSSAPSLGLCPVFHYLSSSSIVTLNFQKTPIHFLPRTLCTQPPLPRTPWSILPDTPAQQSPRNWAHPVLSSIYYIFWRVLPDTSIKLVSPSFVSASQTSFVAHEIVFESICLCHGG